MRVLGGGELRQQICLARPHPKMMVRLHDLQFRLKCFLANQGQPCVVRRGVPHHLPPRPVRHVLLPSGLRSPGNATGSTVSSSIGRTPLQTRGQARFRRPCRTPSAFSHRSRVSSDIRRPGGQPARRSFPVAAPTSRPHGQPVHVMPGIYRVGSGRPALPGPIAAGMTEDRDRGFNRMDRMRATCSRSAPKARAPTQLRRRDAPIWMPARSVPAGGSENPVFGRHGAELSISGTKRPLTPRLRWSSPCRP